jgi:hypothetical protein
MDSRRLDKAMAQRHSISDNHRRGISSTLILLDEMLCRFERWAMGESVRGVLYHEVNDLTDRQRELILMVIEDLRAIMAELKESLSLKYRTQYIANTIWSESASFWVPLVELEPKHLKRYGAVPDDFVDYFAPKLSNLISNLNKIGKITQKQSPK